MVAVEAHPVPQNVTSFEFHLVGNMTLRQFGYLTIGLTIAYLSFLLFANTLPILAWPLILISASIGSAYAFLPIMERPLDLWTAAFIRAVRRPTYRKYSSKTLSPDDPKHKNRLNLYLSLLQPSQPQKTHSAVTPHPLPAAEEKVPPNPPPLQPSPSSSHAAINEFLSNLNKLAETPEVASPIPAAYPTKPTAPTHHPSGAAPSNTELDKTIELAQEAQLIQNKILEAETEIDHIKSSAAKEGTDPRKYTEQFQSVLVDLQRLNEKARQISHELAELSKIPVATGRAEPVAKPNIIPSLTLTAIPNIINGIITDSQGSYIEGAIIVAHDRQGLPVRALKTNKLGQFIAATPLPDGQYTISVEKDDLSFDVIQLELAGKILNPVVISAKRLVPSM